MKDLHGPVLGLYGGADTGISQESVDKMREALKTGSAGGAEVAHRRLSRHAARLQRRLSPELPQGPGGGRLEEGVGLVQGERRKLTA